MMRNYLTKQKALDVTIELWTWLSQPENAGKKKFDWDKWNEYAGLQYCPLCVYTGQYKHGGCVQHCPYYQYYHFTCGDSRSPYRQWDDCISVSLRSPNKAQALNYARQCLNELKTIQSSGKIRGIRRIDNG